MQFEKITNVRLPFDMRDPDPKKNYGISTLMVWFILKGLKGAVQLLVSFPMYLPHVRQELEDDESGTGYWRLFGNRISGYDIGYYSPTPTGDDHNQTDCDLLDGGKCYYDGSSLRAEEWVKQIFAVKGKRPDDVLWKMLEDEYYERFGRDS